MEPKYTMGYRRTTSYRLTGVFWDAQRSIQSREDPESLGRVFVYEIMGACQDLLVGKEIG